MIEHDMTDKLKPYADRISEILRHENEVTNHRLTWLIATQAIMFAASAEFLKSYLFPTIVICLVGILTTWSFAYALISSFESRQHMRKLWQMRLKDNDLSTENFPPLDGAYSGNDSKVWLLPWFFVPKLRLAAWVLLLIYALFFRSWNCT